VCVCVSVRAFFFPGCIAHAPVLLYHIFLHCLINGTVFLKKVIEHKMRVFYFV